MSSDSELLRRAGADEASAHALDALPPAADGPSVRLDLGVIARDETMKLMERLFLLTGASKPPRTVIFASVDAGEASSRICARVGIALADRIPESVCLVDANLYSPSLHRQFGVENNSGLEEMVTGKGPIRPSARRLSAGNLWLVTSGMRHAEPHALLSSLRLRECLTELRNDFAYVLIEAPALSINGTATLLGPLADGVVLIVEANSTRREVARSVKDSLDRANVRLLGAVLNSRTFPIPDVIYRSI